MHWAVILNFWGTEILRGNPGLDEKLLVRAIAHLLDLGDEISATALTITPTPFRTLPTLFQMNRRPGKFVKSWPRSTADAW